MYRLFLLVGFMFCIALYSSVGIAEVAEQRNFKNYKADLTPKKAPSLFKEYRELVNQSEQRAVTQADLIKRFDLMSEVAKQNPEWVDGQWLMASEAFQLASIYIKDEEHGRAIDVYKKGAEAAEHCASLVPNLPLCNDFWGANLAKVAMLNGVFSSLRSAQRIEQLWQSVVDSDINFRFTREVTLQGSVHYALGMFYRLIPDSFIIEWFFSVRGSIDRSIHHHRQNLAIDGITPCGNVMLAASLLCKSKAEAVNPLTVEAIQLIDAIAGFKSFDLNQRNCLRKASSLKEQPDLGCGFTIAIQLDTEPTEANLKKSSVDTSTLRK